MAKQSKTNRMKDIKDYIHLYLGCTVEFVPSGSENREKMYGKVHDFPVSGTEYGIRYIEEFDGHPEILNFAFAPDIKLILRPLSDMTEEEWKKCFELSRGVVDQSFTDKMKKMSQSEVMFVFGKAQFVFGYHLCPDNDVRMGSGICLYLKSYLIKDELSVSQSGIQTSESWYNDMTVEQVHNVNHILNHLRKQKIDIDGLIESGLAIDKTKL